MGLKELRQAAGLTQTAAAGVLGVTQASLCAWEIGTARPALDKLRPIARLYNTTLEAALAAIIGEEDAPYVNIIPTARPTDKGGGRPDDIQVRADHVRADPGGPRGDPGDGSPHGAPVGVRGDAAAG